MEEITPITRFAIPYSKEIEFQNVRYENGFSLIRLRIREGKRFTMIDLDSDTVSKCIAVLSEWQNSKNSDGS